MPAAPAARARPARCPWSQAAREEAEAAGPSAEAGGPADAAPPRQLSSLATHGAEGGATRPTVVSLADVLYLLEREPQTSRSRVLQWWRCENKPLKRCARSLSPRARPRRASRRSPPLACRYARHSSRLFMPDPPDRQPAP